MARNQISLFEGNNIVREIKKHSSIVQMGNITTLQERKAMNSLIRIAKDFLKRNPNERIFHSEIGIIKRLAWLNDSDNSDLKDALRNLSSRNIEYNILNKDREERGTFSFLAEVKITTEGRWKPTTVSFEFPTTVLNVVKNPNMYVKLDLLIIRGLNSKHSVALYELMKDYQNLWRYRCGVGEFRKLMWVKENQYGIFSMFRKRVLEKAIDEINQKTDIELSYELERMGRKIIAIVLTVKAKWKNKLPSEAPKQIEEKLKAFWIRSKKIQTLLEKHDEQYLRANITIVEEQMKWWKISNPVGYLLKAFQNDYRPVETEYSKLQKEAEQKKKLEEESKQKEESEKAELKKDFEKRKSEIVSLRLSKINEQELTERKQDFIDGLESSPLFLIRLQSKWFKDKLIQIQRRKFIEWKLLLEEEKELEFFT